MMTGGRNLQLHEEGYTAAVYFKANKCRETSEVGEKQPIQLQLYTVLLSVIARMIQPVPAISVSYTRQAESDGDVKTYFETS